MSTLANAFALLCLSVALISATNCGGRDGPCTALHDHDATNMLQVKHEVDIGEPQIVELNSQGSEATAQNIAVGSHTYDRQMEVAALKAEHAALVAENHQLEKNNALIAQNGEHKSEEVQKSAASTEQTSHSQVSQTAVFQSALNQIWHPKNAHQQPRSLKAAQRIAEDSAAAFKGNARNIEAGGMLSSALDGLVANGATQATAPSPAFTPRVEMISQGASQMPGMMAGGTMGSPPVLANTLWGRELGKMVGKKIGSALGRMQNGPRTSTWPGAGPWLHHIGYPWGMGFSPYIGTPAWQSLGMKAQKIDSAGKEQDNKGLH